MIKKKLGKKIGHVLALEAEAEIKKGKEILALLQKKRKIMFTIKPTKIKTILIII